MLAFGISGANPTDWEGFGPFLLGSFIGIPIGCAGGTYIIGNAFHQNGRFLPSFLGATLGAGACVGVIALGKLGDWRWSALSLIPTGSVIGYNMSRPKILEKGFLYKYFDTPSFSFRTEKTKDNKIIPVYDFRLVYTRF